VYSSIAILLVYAVPFVCALVPRAFLYVVASGLVLAAAEWVLAYHGSLVENGGDWSGGGELLGFTGVLACLLLGVWVGLALLGRYVGRLRRKIGRQSAQDS
jgi:hypothetical protein